MPILTPYKDFLRAYKKAPPESAEQLAGLVFFPDSVRTQAHAYVVMTRVWDTAAFYAAKDAFYTTCDEVARPSELYSLGKAFQKHMVPNEIDDEHAKAFARYLAAVRMMRILADTMCHPTMESGYATHAGALRWLFESNYLE